MTTEYTLGRVYMPHPDGDNFFFETQIEFCKKQKEPGMNLGLYD
jgi:hypothetical protein